MYEDYEFLCGSVALWSMSIWFVSEDEVKATIQDPDSEPNSEDESGVLKVWAAQTRDFVIFAHYVEDRENRIIRVRLAGGQYDG